uniref:Polyketide synthase dehydratase domain-containing protein n=1 Tax=Zooxanthella nutricula TaxID=1333877 RepID=A0A6U6JSW4_9DINO|mmetsp:Transcript_22059/g.65834  ORF Transcript_22059/g.65834 Transcript_22059/m.65834 type:complete len:359 (+) Transcript_22059:77-1153(+)
MALETTTLATARAKLEAAQSEGQFGVGQGLAVEAEEFARQALVAARRTGNGAARMEALEVLVHAHMITGEFSGQTYAANLAAQDELAMIRRAGDKALEAKALNLVAEVHTWRGDHRGAAQALDEALALHRQASDKAGQAKALRLMASAKLAAGKGNDALTPAQDSLKLFEELGDSSGVELSRHLLNVVFVQLNQLDKAPSRSEALEALSKLASAVDRADAQAWQNSMKDLEKTGAFAQKDVDALIKAALEKDRPSAAAFLEAQGVMVRGAGGAQSQMKEYVKDLCYISFRVGGLGYGPRFRCLSTYKYQVTNDEFSVGALSCLQISKQADDWEAALEYHPGVLDGMLQSGSAMGNVQF